MTLVEVGFRIAPISKNTGVDVSSYSTLESLMGEELRLEDEIRRSQERLDEIRTLLRLTKKFNLVTAPEPIASVLAAQMEHLIELATNPNPPSLKVRIIDACERVLSDGRRRVSRELLPELARMGVIIEGADPAANLSAYLSKEKDHFTSNPKLGGWTLTRLTQRSVPTSQSASEPVVEQMSQSALEQLAGQMPKSALEQLVGQMPKGALEQLVGQMPKSALRQWVEQMSKSDSLEASAPDTAVADVGIHVSRPQQKVSGRGKIDA